MSSTVPNVLPTLTLLESGFTLRPGTEHEFMNMSEKITGVAIEQPGFLSVGGGPIAESSWLYFTVKFETPADMDAWHHHERHQPVQELAKAKWFGRMYLRKWRVPAGGEELGDRVLCETVIAPAAPLDNAQLAGLMFALETSLADTNAKPFETMTGEFEPRPFQLAGPLEEAPHIAPVKYVLVTHWASGADMEKWLASPGYEACQALGDTTSTAYVPVQEVEGGRSGLRPDRLQRDWSSTAK
jgi:heme-degrading monooxygenase HmoA